MERFLTVYDVWYVIQYKRDLFNRKGDVLFNKDIEEHRLPILLIEEWFYYRN